MNDNYFKVIENKIQYFILKRREATQQEQEKINTILTKLYDIKYIMLKQFYEKN